MQFRMLAFARFQYRIVTPLIWNQLHGDGAILRQCRHRSGMKFWPCEHLSLSNNKRKTVGFGHSSNHGRVDRDELL
jgi:hypothetical protein